MTKLPLVSSDKLIKQLLKNGFFYAKISGKGSHVDLVREDENSHKHLMIIQKKSDTEGHFTFNYQIIRTFT